MAKEVKKMTTPTLRQVLEAKKAEIEAALMELDRLEALAGLKAPPPPSINGKSYSQAVLDALQDGERTGQQLSLALGIKEEQVYYAATTHRLRKLVATKAVKGKRSYYLKARAAGREGTSAKGAAPALTDAVVTLLHEASAAMRASQVAKALEGKVASEASDFGRSVASTLATLAKDGRIRRVGPGQYSARERLKATNL